MQLKKKNKNKKQHLNLNYKQDMTKSNFMEVINNLFKKNINKHKTRLYNKLKDFNNRIKHNY